MWGLFDKVGNEAHAKVFEERYHISPKLTDFIESTDNSIICWHKLHFLAKKNQWCYFALLLSPEFLLVSKKSSKIKEMPVPEQCHLGNANLSLCYSGEMECWKLWLTPSNYRSWLAPSCWCWRQLKFPPKITATSLLPGCYRYNPPKHVAILELTVPWVDQREKTHEHKVAK